MSTRRKIEFFAASAKSFGNVISARADDPDGASFWGEKAQLALHGICKTFCDKVAGIQNDRRLTAEGRNEKIREMGTDALCQISLQKTRFLDVLRSRYTSASGKLCGLLAAGDATKAVARMELRTYFRSLGGKERLSAFNRAVEIGDMEIVATFCERAETFQLLAPELLRAGLKMALTKKQPELAAEYFDAERAGSVVTENFRDAISELALYSATPADDVKHLLDALPREDWSHEVSADDLWMKAGTGTSNLPAMTMSSLSDSRALDSAR